VLRTGTVLVLVGVLAASAAQDDIVLDRPILSMGQEGSGRTFTRIRDYQYADDGRYYLLDLKAPFIAVYSSSGEFLFEFGNSGQGPGELLRPVRLQNASGTTVILDTNRNRISEYNASGEFVRSYTSIYSLFDIAVTADAVYASVIHQSAGIIRIPRGNPRDQQVILNYDNAQELGQALSVVSFHMEALTLCLHESTLIGAAPTSALLIVNELDDIGTWRAVEVESTSIDAFIDHYVNENGDWRAASSTVRRLPIVLRGVRPWLDGNLITDAYTYEKGIRYQSMAMIIDPETGKEVGPRIGSMRDNLYLFKLIGDDRLAAVNGESATLEIFRLR